MKRLAIALAAAGLAALVLVSIPSRGDTMSPEPQKPDGAGARLRIISSSHQDIAWMDSPEACRRYRDVSCITPALEMMRTNPEYRFVMENMLNLEEYLETHPERRAEIERYTREGRLEWGATYTQPYESLLSGEQLVRQVYFGRLWLHKTFPGADARVYFNPDVPGRAMQMQQILKKAGVPYMVISRYHEGLYDWGSPDGSSVLAFSPGHYGNASAWLNAKPEDGVKAIAERWEKRRGYYEKRGLPFEFPLLHSEDFSKPTDYRPLIDLWNTTRGKAGPGGAGAGMMYSSARGFFEALAAGRPSFDKVSGERPNLWLYIHGPTHHEAISAQREAGVLLPAAETFQTIDALLAGSFENYPARELDEAWRAAVYPDHGWGGKEGQVTDRLFRKKYELARDEGRRHLNAALGRIAGRVADGTGEGRSIVIFNDLSWTRTAPVTVEIPAGDDPPVILDSKGTRLAVQVLPAEAGPRPARRKIEFIAPDVPGIGYKRFTLGPAGSAGAAGPTAPAVERTADGVENQFYRIRLVPGGVAGIFDKELGREILDTGKFLGFEVFTMKSVGNGAGEFGRVQQPTMEGFDRTKNRAAAWTFDEAASGPVRSVFETSAVFGDARVRQRLVVYAAVKRIDCEVDILGWDGNPYREWRLAVPCAAPNGKVAYEVPLGVVEVGESEAKSTGGAAYGNLVYDELFSEIRPREVQNFLNVSGDGIGVTLTTPVAVNDYKDPTADPAAVPVLQGVLLASRRSCHGQGNWYLQEGDHHYRFSLTSHAPGWRNGYQAGIAPNHPLIAVLPGGKSGRTGGAPPAEAGFLATGAPNILVSTFKKSESGDSAVLRVYDIEGRAADADVRAPALLAKAESVNMIEEDGMPLALKNGRLRFPVGRYAIETVRLFPAARR